MTIAWRLVALAGAATGLAASPAVSGSTLPGLEAIALAVLAAVALARVRPRRAGLPAAIWLAAVGGVAAGAGLVAGAERVAAIDAAAYAGEPGSQVSVRGFVTAVPRPVDGGVTVPVSTQDGKLAIEAPEPDRELDVGQEVRASGTVREPEPWRAGRLRIAGIHRLVAARWIETTSRRRGGVAGAIDDSRERAESALDRGIPDREAALSRGFVLGQDDRLDPATVDDFRRSGLAHLLAVSGQNVLLLALLAIPVLALLGVPLRARLLAVIALIAVYVPITGAGPSIQRAAVMGAAGIVAVLAGRPSHRWYALGLAAAVTLAMNPRAAADVGWQLSFAAVVGILLWARPLAALATRALGRPRERPGGLDLRRGLADGIGVTVAATIATAPISAHHFETISLASLPANLLALPAVAPVMWLGMLSAALGQLTWVPVEPLNWLCSLLVAYIAQIAHWLGSPSWAATDIAAPGPAAVAAILAGLALAGAIATRGARRRAGLRGAARVAVPAGLAAAALSLAVLAGAGSASPAPAERAPALSLSVLDVGQGDAILLDPEPGGAILVDAGPPGADLASELADRGVDRLSAAVVTHDQADHAGGLGDVLATAPAGTVGLAEGGRRLRLAVRAAGARIVHLEEGRVLRAGDLSLEVLWPPPRGPAAGAAATDDPNARSLVLLARWRRFEALLTGDAEAELAPVDPGPVDLLKVAHHGSEDAGLEALLERAHPRLAVISVGADNPYGHPHPATIAALAEAGVPTLRTDEDGDVDVQITGGTMRVGGSP